MHMARSYEQFCPMAAALDAIGARWALLVVRELMLGPRSFTQLTEALAGIGTDILTARLRSLEHAGVVHRIGEGRRRDYALTDEGRALQAVLSELARWGAARLAPLRNPNEVSTRTALTALLLDARPIPTGLEGTYEIKSGQDVALVSVRGTKLMLDSANEAEADSTVASMLLTRAGLFALILGTKARSLLEGGKLEIHGQKRKAIALIDALAAPELIEPMAVRMGAAGLEPPTPRV